MRIKSLFNHEYVKHIATLCSGTVVAQFISLCAYPILSRLYSPEDYGILATLSQIATILTIIASCKYETNILIEKRHSEAVDLLYFTILFAFIVLLTILIITESLIQTRCIPKSEITRYISVSFIMAFMIVIYQCYNEWCVRNKKFKNLSVNKVVNTSSISSSELILGFTQWIGGTGLFVGDMFGRIISAASCIISFHKSFGIKYHKIKISNLLKAGRKNSDCPKYVMPAQLINVLGGALPVLLIGYFYNQNDVGLFSMANLVIIAPSSVLSLAIRDVFRQKASEEYLVSGECKKLYLRNLYILSGLSFVIFSLLAMVIKPLFYLLLGSQWTESATYAIILMPMVFFSFISDALSSMMIISRKLNYILYWQIGYFLLSAIPLIIGGLLHSIYLTLGLFCIGRSIAYIVNLSISYRIARGQI